MMSDMRAIIAGLVLFATTACSATSDDSAVRTDSVPADTVASVSERPGILFLGTSLTAGYGVGLQQAYPSVIQQKLDSAGYAYRVINAGLSGETSAGGLRRIDWSLQQPFDVFVLELGANDGLRGLSVDAMRANLDTILMKVKASNPDAAIVIAGMEAPPNLGAKYTTSFRNVFRDLAAKYDATLIPFLLEGVGGKPQLNQDDGIHPNVAGHKLVAQNVWQRLQPLLDARKVKLKAPATRS